VRLRLACAATLALAPAAAQAWGLAGHRIVNQKAAATLPAPLRAVFEANAEYLGEHSIDPDLWRRFGTGASDHYFHMDVFGSAPGEGIPRDERVHLATHGPGAAEEGRLPWKVAQVHAELVAAFRAGDAPRLLERAAVLGHYIGDAHVPLHAIRDYDGQAVGQAGVHRRWEGALVARFERQIERRVEPAPARPAADPWEAALAALRESALGAPALRAADRELRGPADFAATPQDDRYDDAYYSGLFEREGGRVVSRLAAAAHVLGSLWLSAWEAAGRPEVPSDRLPYVRRATRAVMVSLDGLGAMLAEDALARGVMPQLAALRQRGAWAASAGPLPTKTAPAHAALYTGAWPERNGITGNEVPVPGGSIDAFIGGYRSEPLRAEPLWVAAAREGLDATVVGATQVAPFGPYLAERRFGADFGAQLTLVDGYAGAAIPDAVYRAADLRLSPASGWAGLPQGVGTALEFSLEVGEARVFGLVYDDPQDKAAGFDSVRLTAAKSEPGVTLKPSPPRGADASAFQGLRLRVNGAPSAVFFRLFALGADARETLLYRTEARSVAAHPAALIDAILDETGGFVGNSADGLYRGGALGATLARGGDGSAEARYLETAALCLRQMERLARFGWDRTRWDLLFAYVPLPDEALHAFTGYLDPSLPGHDPVLASRLRPITDDLLRAVDRYLGALADKAGAGVLLAVVADHGHLGVSAVVRPNVALAQAGLLTRNAAGGIDAARTQAYFPLNEGGYIIIKGNSAADGSPSPAAGALRARVAATLGRLADPSTGKPVITELIDVRDAPRAGLSPAGGDLFLLAAPGYTVSESLSGPAVEAIEPKGTHFQDPERREMLAAILLSGPGVAAGVDLGTIRHVDLAPTLAALLGISPPTQSQGRVLHSALARPIRPGR
jgi:predicted AlkP superfamily pyrophosphatase or phosphodiesterase